MINVKVLMSAKDLAELMIEQNAFLHAKRAAKEINDPKLASNMGSQFFDDPNYYLNDFVDISMLPKDNRKNLMYIETFKSIMNNYLDDHNIRKMVDDISPSLYEV